MTYAFLNKKHSAMHMPQAVRAGSAMSVEDALAFFGDCGAATMEYDVKNGTAVIAVSGALVSNLFPWWFFYGDTTYESLLATISDAVLNPDVSAVVLRLNSPGGTVIGCAEAAAQLDKLAQGDKPIITHAVLADSAAYWLASATNGIIVDPTGEVGSIGVIGQHADYSEAYKDWGVTITDIFAGKHKADGSPHKPLSKQAEDRFNADMQYLRGQFAEGVAAYRGMDVADVLRTEAMTYIGQQAVDVGLADDVMFFGDLLGSIDTLTFK